MCVSRQKEKKKKLPWVYVILVNPLYLIIFELYEIFSDFGSHVIFSVKYNYHFEVPLIRNFNLFSVVDS